VIVKPTTAQLNSGAVPAIEREPSTPSLGMDARVHFDQARFRVPPA
jgi:hypothetical protein